MTTFEDVFKEVWGNDAYRVQDRISHGSTVLDIGANTGTFSIGCALLGAKVLALEPHAASFERFRINVTGTAWEQAIRREVWALGPGVGWCTTVDRGLGVQVCDWSEGHTRQVSIESLGEWDICKIDIEGAEYAALTNADLGGLGYLAIEFHVTRPVGSPHDDSIGASAVPFVPGSVEQLCAWLERTHSVELVGDVESGGYIYAVRR